VQKEGAEEYRRESMKICEKLGQPVGESNKKWNRR
jgi:hypothetical protein